MILRGPRSVCLLVALLAAPASAQSVAVAVYGAAVSNSEVDSTRQARGLGVAADVRIDYGRFRFEARGVTASLDADFSVQPDYAMHTLEATATYRWHPLLALEAGIGRRLRLPRFHRAGAGAAPHRGGQRDASQQPRCDAGPRGLPVRHRVQRWRRRRLRGRAGVRNLGGPTGRPARGTTGLHLPTDRSPDRLWVGTHLLIHRSPGARHSIPSSPDALTRT